MRKLLFIIYTFIFCAAIINAGVIGQYQTSKKNFLKIVSTLQIHTKDMRQPVQRVNYHMIEDKAMFWADKSIEFLSEFKSVQIDGYRYFNKYGWIDTVKKARRSKYDINILVELQSTKLKYEEFVVDFVPEIFDVEISTP